MFWHHLVLLLHETVLEIGLWRSRCFDHAELVRRHATDLYNKKRTISSIAFTAQDAACERWAELILNDMDVAAHILGDALGFLDIARPPGLEGAASVGSKASAGLATSPKRALQLPEPTLVDESIPALARPEPEVALISAFQQARSLWSGYKKGLFLTNAYNISGHRLLVCCSCISEE